jgi:hypothetical protein
MASLCALRRFPDEREQDNAVHQDLFGPLAGAVEADLEVAGRERNPTQDPPSRPANLASITDLVDPLEPDNGTPLLSHLPAR